MSVLIKGVKMPKNCNSCPLNYDYFACIITQTNFFEGETAFDDETGRLENCPLIELPDNGDLPSAEKRMEWIAVEERMPQDGEWAIFTDGKNISVERYKMDIGQDHFFPSGRWFDLEEAIAWMPLPKHYHGTENKNEH